MKSLVLSLTICFLLTACSNVGTVRSVNGNKVVNIEDPVDLYSVAYVDYYDVETLRAEEVKKAELTFGEPDFRKIPEHGYIRVHVKTPDIDSANTKWWTVVVKDKNGIVVVKRDGPNSIADYQTSGGITVWKNSLIVSLPELEAPFEVFIISNILKKRWGYQVTGE